MSIPFSNGRPLPLEILENIAYELARSSPLGPPVQIMPLLLTNRAINQALSMDSGTPLYSHICRLKFDVGAVTRRAFAPGVKDLNGHLIQMCNLLRFIRRGDIHGPDVDDQLLIAYVAMLDNDGKNRAQLRHAGIEDLVDRFVRSRLHEGMEANNMWPQDSIMNSCALWLMWMFTSKESLERETPQQREEIIRLVFPYIACPYRYPCAFVPPNHFTLPLGKTNPVQSDLFTTETEHGPFPLYHTYKHAPLALWYFRCSPSFLPPLITPVAKLLYWSRREIGPFFRNPYLPATRAQLGRPGLTQEDLADFNRHKVARLLDDVVWDWDIGAPVCRVQDGNVPSSPSHIKWKEDESSKWDKDWWRARLCDDILFTQPKWRLGSVYQRGTLTGSWQGVQFTGSTTFLAEMLAQAEPPANFSEEAMIFGARPLMMRLTEHGFVRTLKTAPASSSSSRGAQSTDPIPCAPPVNMQITLMTPTGPEHAMVPVDGSLSNAWLPGPIGSLKWVEGGDRLDEGVMRDRYAGGGLDGKEAMSSTVFVTSSGTAAALPGGPIHASEVAPTGRDAGHVFVYEAFDPEKESVHQRMERAKRQKELCQVVEGDEGVAVSKVHPGCSRCADREAFLNSRRERDAHKEAGQREAPPRHVEEAFEAIGLGKRGDMSGYFPAENSVLGGPSEEDDLVPVELTSGADDTEDEEAPLRLEFSPISSGYSDLPPSRSVTSSPSSSEGTLDYDEDDEGDHDDGDDEDHSQEPDIDHDFEEGHPGIRDSSGKHVSKPLRRSHDRYRVEECDDGVEDVVITGDMNDENRAAWGKNIYYGRVRPWDGLIAVLRVAYDRNGEVNGHMIYYGYIYGGDTFIGNWKYAGMDPLLPGFECSFVMSKKMDD